MQEQQDDDKHQPDGFEDGTEHVGDGAVDEDGGVIAHRHRRALRQFAVEAGQQLLHLARHIERVCHRRLDDADRDGGRAIVAAFAADIRRAELNARNIAEAHLQPATFLQHDVGEFLRRAERGARQNGELALGAFDAACGNVGILIADGGFDILHGKALPREAHGVDPHPHGVNTLAIDADIRHAIKVLEAINDEAVYVVRELCRIQRVRLHNEKHDGLCIGLHLGNGGLADLIGQLPPDAAHPVAHVARGGIDVDGGAEAHGDAALLGARG